MNQSKIDDFAVITDPEEDESRLSITIRIPNSKNPSDSIERVFQFDTNETVWVAKQMILKNQRDIKDGINYGLYLPPSNARAGKFLDEERRLNEYGIVNGQQEKKINFLEFKYKQRVYKMTNISLRKLRQYHSRSNLRQFFDYVRKGDCNKINSMTAKGMDPNFIENDTGETPLTMATRTLKKQFAKDIILALFSGGAHLDFRNRNGLTPIHSAAMAGNYEAVKILLDLGASPNYKDRLGLTPLYLAVVNNADSRICETLLHDHSVLCLSDDQGWTEIHHACRCGNSETLEHLLYYGADMNVQNESGNTPLHIAALNNHEGCVRMLLIRGADKFIQNYSSQDARQIAVIANNFQISELIADFDRNSVIPIQEVPKYNERRRSVWTAGTLTRSKSDPRINLAGRSFSSRSSSPTNSIRSIPTTPSTISNGNTSTILPLHFDNNNDNDNNYLKKNYTSNETKTVVLQKSRSGFGFVLRGTKAQGLQNLNFEPTQTVPALQFLDRVEAGSPAYKAGLKPGDYIVEINHNNIIKSSHEDAVRIIKQSGDTLVLKVVTVDVTQQIISPNKPAPPLRSASTSLSSSSSSKFSSFKDSTSFDKNTASIQARAVPRRPTAAEINNIFRQNIAKPELPKTQLQNQHNNDNANILLPNKLYVEPLPDYQGDNNNDDVDDDSHHNSLSSSPILPPPPPPLPKDQITPPKIIENSRNERSHSQVVPIAPPIDLVAMNKIRPLVNGNSDEKSILPSKPQQQQQRRQQEEIQRKTAAPMINDNSALLKAIQARRKKIDGATTNAVDDDDHDDSTNNIMPPPPPEFGEKVDKNADKFIEPPLCFRRQSRSNNINDWTIEDVIEWLDEIEMQTYKEKFRIYRVDGKSLSKIDRLELMKMGVTQIGDRMSIEKAIKNLVRT